MKADAKTPARHVNDLRFHLLSAAKSAKAVADQAVGPEAIDRAEKLNEAAMRLRQRASELGESIRGPR